MSAPAYAVSLSVVANSSGDDFTSFETSSTETEWTGSLNAIAISPQGSHLNVLNQISATIIVRAVDGPPGAILPISISSTVGGELRRSGQGGNAGMSAIATTLGPGTKPMIMIAVGLSPPGIVQPVGLAGGEEFVTLTVPEGGGDNLVSIFTHLTANAVSTSQSSPSVSDLSTGPFGLQIFIHVVPELSSYLLLVTGLVGLILLRLLRVLPRLNSYR